MSEQPKLATDTNVEAETPTPLITDMIGLFQYSGMVDTLRDTAEKLLGHTVDAVTLRQMTMEYNALRHKLLTVLPAEAAERTWCLEGELIEESSNQHPEITERRHGVGSVSEVYFAAAMLAQWATLVHNQDAFILSKKVQEMQQAQVATQMQAPGGLPTAGIQLGGPSGPPTGFTVPPAPGTGHYM